MSSYLSVFIQRFDTDPPDAAIDSGGVGDLVSAGPNMIKVFNSVAQARWAHNANKNLTVVIRHMAALEDPFEGWELTAENAAKYWQAIQPFLAQLKDRERYIFNLWPNEPGIGSQSERRALSTWWATLYTLADKAGVQIAGFNLSAEAAPLLVANTDDFYDALQAAFMTGGWVDLHGYSPDFTRPEFDVYLYPWRALRAKLATKCPRILCGEFGVDDNITTGTIVSGYRTRYSNETYAAWLTAAGSKLAADGVNAFVFWASFAADSQFQQYNINIGVPATKAKPDGDPSVWARIRPYIVSQIGASAPAPQPQPDPTPTPTPDPAPQPKTVTWLGVVVGEGESLNVRNAPVNGAVIFQVVQGEALEGIQLSNGWWQLKPRARYPLAFVSAAYVKEV